MRSGWYIIFPLRPHPNHRASSHSKRARKAGSQLGGAVEQPFASVMPESKDKGRQGQLVDDGVLDVVCSVEANQGGEQSPSAVGVSLERSDLESLGAVKDPAYELCCQKALNRVGCRDRGNLTRVSSH